MSISPEWVSALSAIALAIVATITILREQIRSIILQPDFELGFRPEQPDCHFVPYHYQSLIVDSHYVRARVKNTGRTSAKNIEVAVTEVRRKKATGKFSVVEMATPWNLVWAHHDIHVLDQIPPKTERHITLGHILDPSQRKNIPHEDKSMEGKPSETLFALEFFVKSNTKEYLLEVGEYKLELEISAANCRSPKKFTFYLNHIGKWFREEDKMYSDGLGLELK